MAGYKSFGSEVLTADDVNEYLMRQAVIRVANASQLAAIPTPEIGMMAHRSDNGVTYQHDGVSWVPKGAALPGRVAADGSTGESVTATAWAPLPTPRKVTLELPCRALVAYTLSAWLVTSGASAGSLRIRAFASGATSWPHQWGETLYANAGQTTHAQSFSGLREFEAGTTTLEVEAYAAGVTGVVQVSYSHIEATPIRAIA